MPIRTKFTEAAEFKNLYRYLKEMASKDASKGIDYYKFNMEFEERREDEFYLTFFASNGGFLNKLKKELPYNFWYVKKGRRELVIRQEDKDDIERALAFLDKN